ncbi:MAG: HAMP domain-containing sensor histidine kinase [bacterium]
MTPVAAFLYGMLAGGGAVWILARRRDARRADYLAYVLHEINNSITGAHLTVKNFILEIFGPLPEKQKPWMEMLEDHTERLSCMSGDLKDFVTLEFGKGVKPQLQITDLKAVTDEALGKYASVVSRAGIRISAELPENAFALADKEMLGRIIGNMLERCCQFSSRDQTVSVFLRPSGDFWELSVSHGGYSLPRADLAAAFALMPRRKSKNGRRVYSGPGLGLGLCRKLVELQGGVFSVENCAGGGERIFFMIPRRQNEKTQNTDNRGR